ncbi:hypothetical protein MESS2_10054 [Mesorhizobium metallidurans STM 2683]|uniref:Uncharacterized protein n=1 Tax=Mesorhizobium metallidurans STM 2683 TaxID=1297569 RepID=M5EFK7_9HYPH|nr:hypothetical protein MESS2_10054 [Mesorhizobium metallidurans STM 2683]
MREAIAKRLIEEYSSAKGAADAVWTLARENQCIAKANRPKAMCSVAAVVPVRNEAAMDLIVAWPLPATICISPSPRSVGFASADAFVGGMSQKGPIGASRSSQFRRLSLIVCRRRFAPRCFLRMVIAKSGRPGASRRVSLDFPAMLGSVNLKIASSTLHTRNDCVWSRSGSIPR